MKSTDNKTETVRIRVSKENMEFLKKVSKQKGMTVGQYVKRHYISF